MNKIDKSLQTIFSTMDLTVAEDKAVEAVIEQERLIDTPYDEVIINLRRLIDRAEDAMNSSQSAAESTEVAEDFDAYSKVAKNLIDMNRELRDAITAREKYRTAIKNENAAQKEKEKEEGTDNVGTHTTNNIIAIGTTADLQRLLKQTMEQHDYIDVKSIPTGE